MCGVEARARGLKRGEKKARKGEKSGERKGLKVHPVISKLRVRVTRGGMMNPERIRQSIFCIVGQAYLCQRV